MDRVAKSGDTMSGTLTLEGSPPLAIPGGLPGGVLTLDGAGNVTPQTGAGLLPAGSGAADTANIQGLLNITGRAVLGPGAFSIVAVLNPPAGISPISGALIQGSEWGTSLNFDQSVVPTLIKLAGSTQGKVDIRNLRIAQSGAADGGTAIDMSLFVNSVIENVSIDAGSGGKHCLNGIVATGVGTEYNTVRECRISVNGTGAKALSWNNGVISNSVQDIRVLVGTAGGTGSAGVYLNTHSNRLTKVDVENAPGDGIFLDSAAHATVVDAAYLESNNVNLHLGAGVQCPTILGGTIQSAVTANIQDDGAFSPIIVNGWENNGNLGVLSTIAALLPNIRLPQDLGLVAWNQDPVGCGANATAANGTLYLARVPIRQTTKITNLAIYLATAASGVTANQNFLALISSTGAIVGQTAAGVLDTKITSNGWVSAAMSAAVTVQPGYYWVAALFNATTPPVMARNTGLSLGGPNAGQAASSFWFATNGTGLTAIPGSITPGSNTQTGAATICVGLS